MNALHSYGSLCARFLFLPTSFDVLLLIWFKSIFVHLFSMTDSCLLICVYVYKCLQYPHYLHMIIVTINRSFVVCLPGFFFVLQSIWCRSPFLNLFNNSPINTLKLNACWNSLRRFRKLPTKPHRCSWIEWYWRWPSDALWNVRHFCFRWNTSFESKLPAILLHFIVITKSSNCTKCVIVVVIFYISINFLKSIRILVII